MTKSHLKGISVEVPTASSASFENLPMPPAGEAAPRSGETQDLSEMHLDMPGLGDMIEIASEERERWIAEAAYYVSQRRNGAPSSQEDDWAEAEEEIDRMLAEKSRNS